MAEQTTSGTPDFARIQPVQLQIAAPRVYANAFLIGASNADVHLEFRNGGDPVVAVQMSYIVANSLHQKLAQAMARIEEALGRPIPTTEDVDRAFKASSAVKLEK